LQAGIKTTRKRPCQSKITWNQVCVLARQLNFEDFSSAKLYQQRISCLHVVTEKFEVPKFILPVKISWLIFSAVSGVEMKNLQISEQAHFLISRLRRSISRSRLRRTRLCSNVSLLAGYILKLTVLLIHLNGFYTHLNAIIFEKKRT